MDFFVILLYIFILSLDIFVFMDSWEVPALDWDGWKVKGFAKQLINIICRYLQTLILAPLRLCE